MKLLGFVLFVLLLTLSQPSSQPVLRSAPQSLPSPLTATPHTGLSQPAVQAAGRGAPWINLRDGQDLLPSGAINNLLSDATAQPLALAAGDFDEDGVPDLLSSYASAEGGVLVWQRGNVDAIYPDTPEAEQRRARGEFTDAPFFAPARTVALPAAADFVGTGDFNADGHLDVTVAARGAAALYWLAGDGRGGFGAAQAVKLPGNVTTLTTGEINRADGLADVVVGVTTDDGAQALVFEGPEGAFSRAPEAFALPAAATSFALGQLDEHYEMDLAVAAGSELLIVHGRDRCLSVGQERQAEVKAAVVDTHALPFTLASLAVGDFSGDARNEIAALSVDGVVQILGQDERRKTLNKLVGEVATRNRNEAVATNSNAAPLLVRARVSVSGYDDLVVVEHGAQQLQILTGAMLRGEEARAAAEPREPVALSVAGEPVAVLPMRLNMDALSDLVVLKRGGASSIAAAMTAEAATFTVNNNGNQNDAQPGNGICETVAGNGQCTLRAAIQETNASAGADQINFSVSSITPTSLPNIDDAVTIDGGLNRVEINGGSAAALVVRGGRNTIRNLVLNRFLTTAIQLDNPGGNNFIEGNYIGTDVSGDNASYGSSRWSGIVIGNSPNNTIGGTALPARNVISVPGDTCIGIGQSSGHKIQGNYIGTDAQGKKALGSSTGIGTAQSTQALNLTIGGTEANAGNLISCTGTTSTGNCFNLDIRNAGTLVQQNLIGTDVSGTAALSTRSIGVQTSFATITIGGTTPAARNLISGNTFDQNTGGINVSASAPVLIQGNYIGTDLSGTKALGNSNGVRISGNSTNTGATTIGGTTAAARNIIAGNTNRGVDIQSSNNNVIQGNYIGTDKDGVNNLGNAAGVFVNGNNNQIGGQIGGSDSNAGNVIAFSSNTASGYGVRVFQGTGNAVRRNSIFGNARQAVFNDATPAVPRPTLSGATGTLSGATANTAYTIEFFANDACGAANTEQAKRFISDGTATTNASGAATFTIPAGQNVTATATANGQNTSTISNCVAGSAAGTLTLAPTTLTFNATLGNNPASQIVTLSNTGGAALTWQAAATTTSGGNWLTVTPAAGSLNAGQAATLTAAVNVSALAAGTYNGTITVTSPNASNSPRTVPVTLTVAVCPPALEADSDELTLSNVMPPDGTLVSGASLKIGGLKGTVTWLLQSQNDATLVVRLFDQDGNTRGDAGSITVTKPTECPPKESGQDFAFDRSKLDLTPLNGVPVTSLKLSAIMSGRNGEVIKRADVNYRVIPDAIAFDGTPKINGLDAPDGSRLPADGKVNFTSAIKYHLTNDVVGKIRLRALNANGGGQIASKDLTPNVAATANPTIWNTPLDFQFTVPPNVSEILIVASLLAENGVELTGSTLRFYGNGLQLDFGVQYKGSAFQPYPPPPSFYLGAGGPFFSQALKFRTPLPDNLRGSKFIVSLAQRYNNGDLIHGPYTVDYQPGDDFPQPSFLLDLPLVIPDDVDKYEFQILIVPPNNAPVIESEILSLPIHRLRITSTNPPLDRKLQADTLQDFVFFVAYQAVVPATITAKVDYVYAREFPGEQTIRFDNGEKPGGAYNSRGEEFKFTLNLRPDLVLLRVTFMLGTDQIAEKVYTKFEPPPLTFNAGTKQTLNGIGIDVTTIENIATRTVNAVRDANNAKNAALEGVGLLKPNLSPPPSANNTPEATAEMLATASLLKDFIGLNATWQFDPPIPADGSFVADLKFYYSADDLPDDPNFNEATMKVIGFDPATGKLESYPTTIDLNEKTATARVNGLLPMYSLGVFGPFGHRTLNFPVLRSLSNFTSQLYFANFGSLNAGLSARAFTPTGQTHSGTGIVNPLTTTLPAGRTLSGLASDLFKFPAPPNGGWVQTQADKNFVAGYQMLGKDDRLDGLSLPAPTAGTQVLTDVQYDATMTTEIHVANVTRFDMNLTLELRTAAGALAGSYETSLAPKETFANRVQDIFTSIAQPFTGYVIVRGSQDLSVAALQLGTAEITALTGQIALVSNTPTKLYAPYVLTDNQAITTRLNLVNPTTSAANLTLKLVNENGANLAAPVNVQLAAGQQQQRDITLLFNLTPSDLVYGAIIVESNITGIVGNVSYLDPQGQFPFRAALPLESEAANNFAFAYLDNREDSFTEVAVFNPQTQAATVTLKVFKSDGSAVGTATFSVPAGGFYTDLVDSIVEASFGQQGGYFTLSGNQPVIANAAFGTLAGTMIAALPGQSFDPATSTRTATTVSAAHYRGPELAAESIVSAFGTALATGTAPAVSLPLPTELAGTTVRVQDSAGTMRLAPLFYVGPQQINYLLPLGTALGTATVTITSSDGTTSTGTANITQVVPGFFTANQDGAGAPAGFAIRVKANGEQSREPLSRLDTTTGKHVPAPIDLGPADEVIILELYGTGIRGRSAQSAVSATMGGVAAGIEYADRQPGFLGLDQVNIRVPRSLIGRGEVDLVLMVEGKAANVARLNVR